jgi:hypothetical protein
MELKELPNFWKTAGQKLPVGLQTQVSTILKDLLQHADEIGGLEKVKQQLVPGVLNQIEGAIKSKQVKEPDAKAALEAVRSMGSVVSLRIQELKKLDQKLNADRKQLLDTAGAFLKNESMENYVEVGKAAADLVVDCKNLKHPELKAVAERIHQKATIIVTTARSELSPLKEAIKSSAEKAKPLTTQLEQRKAEMSKWLGQYAQKV